MKNGVAALMDEIARAHEQGRSIEQIRVTKDAIPGSSVALMLGQDDDGAAEIIVHPDDWHTVVTGALLMVWYSHSRIPGSAPKIDSFAGCPVVASDPADLSAS